MQNISEPQCERAILTGSPDSEGPAIIDVRNILCSRLVPLSIVRTYVSSDICECDTPPDTHD